MTWVWVGGAIGFVARVGQRERFSGLSSSDADIEQAAALCVHVHVALTSGFVGCVTRWGHDGLDPRHQRTYRSGPVSAIWGAPTLATLNANANDVVRGR